MTERRIFWGRSLPQAVAKAARHYHVPPEELAWRRHEKRHGFVKHPRAVLVEVDPQALRRAPLTDDRDDRAAAAAPDQQAPSAPPQRREGGAESAARDSGRSAAAAPRESRDAPPARATASSPRPAASRSTAPRSEEPFDAPDDESEQAAIEAIRRLLRFVALDAEPTIARRDDRFEIALAARAGAGDVDVGVDLLDELEHLLPKAIFTLSGKRVRATVDFGGRREARAEELRAIATELAERVRASGAAETLGPLPAAERRVVHLLFESDPEIATESVGDGYRKRLRLIPRRG